MPKYDSGGEGLNLGPCGMWRGHDKKQSPCEQVQEYVLTPWDLEGAPPRYSMDQILEAVIDPETG